MTPLETYLNRATRGLWGKQKAEIVAELRGSLEARIWKLECQGFTPQHALETALGEMGEPRFLSAGLSQVHTMPRIFKNTLALGLFAALSLTAINSGRAQIEVATFSSISIKALGNVVSLYPASGHWEAYYLKFDSIKQNLEAAGIVVDDTPQKPLESYDRAKTVPTLRFTFPGSAKATVLQASPMSWKDDKGNLIWSSAVEPPSGVSKPDFYLPFWAFMTQIRQRSGLPVQLTGWHNPKLKIGSTSLQIGSDRLPANPWQIYTSIAGRVALSSFPQMRGWLSISTSRTHGIRVDAPPGTVYALVTPSENPDYHHIDAARVADDGVLYFAAPYRVLEFVKTSLAVVRDRANVKKRGYGSSSRPAKALLIRISPDLKTSFELPARTRSAALK